MQNRVKDLYETAEKFLSLPTMAQYIIGTSFQVIKWEEFVLKEDKIAEIIFERIWKTKKYEDFRPIVMNYNKQTFRVVKV